MLTTRGYLGCAPGMVILGEGMKLQIRGEFVNFTNTPRFGLPGIFFGDPDFGLVTSTLNNPRHTQFGVRFQFLNQRRGTCETP